MHITKENYRRLDHISDTELQADIDEINRECKDYEDEKYILMRNPVANRLRIYMLEGKISANNSQLEQLKILQQLR